MQATFNRLTLSEKVSQLFVRPVFSHHPGEMERLKEWKLGGITRFFGAATDQEELAFFDQIRAASTVPPLITADLKGSRMSLPFGWQVLNPLGLAAINDVEAALT